LLFCEGTRFTKSKHEQSLKIAKEKGLPQLKHHLLPRTKGFSLLARGARQRNLSSFRTQIKHFKTVSFICLIWFLVDAVYDLTIGIENVNEKPADLNAVRNGIPLKSELYVRRFSFKDIPESEEESAKFIHKLYVEKVKRKLFESYKSISSKFNFSRMKYMMCTLALEVSNHWEKRDVEYRLITTISIFLSPGLFYFAFRCFIGF